MVASRVELKDLKLAAMRVALSDLLWADLWVERKVELSAES